MARKGNTATAAQALTGLLSGLESGTRVRESLALAYWEHAAGEYNAAASEAEAVRDGILFVRTKSSMWSQELNFHKERLIEELNRLIGKAAIRDIRFRATGLRKKKTAQAAPEEDHPSAATLEALVLPEEEQAALQQDIAELCSIADDDLRLAVARRMTNSRKLRRWRLDHGWRECRRCGAPHQAEGNVCPICRLCP